MLKAWFRAKKLGKGWKAPGAISRLAHQGVHSVMDDETIALGWKKLVVVDML